MNFNGLSNVKAVLLKAQECLYLIHRCGWGYKRVHTSPKRISPKVNVLP